MSHSALRSWILAIAVFLQGTSSSAECQHPRDNAPLYIVALGGVVLVASFADLMAVRVAGYECAKNNATSPDQADRRERCDFKTPAWSTAFNTGIIGTFAGVGLFVLATVMGACGCCYNTIPTSQYTEV